MMLFRLTFLLLCLLYIPACTKLNTESDVNRISVNIPFTIERNDVVKSALTMDVYAQRLEVNLSDYLESKSSGPEATLKAILDAVTDEDFENFRMLIDAKEVYTSMFYDQMVAGNSNVSFSESTRLLYKVFIGEDVVFLTATRFMGKHLSVALLFRVGAEGDYVLTDFRGENKIARLLKTAIHSQYISNTKINYIQPYFKRNISRELIGGSYPVTIGFDKEWVVNQYPSDDDRIKYAKSNDAKSNDAKSNDVQKVLKFYASLGNDFSSRNFDQAFSKIDDRGVERLTGGETKFDETLPTIYFKMATIPRYLVGIVDADPFYLVFGTPFSGKYQTALAEPKEVDRINALGELGLNHYYIRRRNDGSLRIEHFNVLMAEDDLFSRRDFIENIIAPGLIRN